MANANRAAHISSVQRSDTLGFFHSSSHLLNWAVTHLHNGFQAVHRGLALKVKESGTFHHKMGENELSGVFGFDVTPSSCLRFLSWSLFQHLNSASGNVFCFRMICTLVAGFVITCVFKEQVVYLETARHL